MRTASIRLDASATPCPAISNAVPWSGLVRTNGRPRVTFTPLSTPRYLTGIRPLVVVHRDHDIKLTRMGLGVPSPHERRYRGNGPCTSYPLRAQLSQSGSNDFQLLPAKQTTFAGMGVEPCHSDTRRTTQGAQQCRMRDLHGLQHVGLGRQHQSHRAGSTCDADQHRAQLIACQHHAHRHRIHRHALVGGGFGLGHSV